MEMKKNLEKLCELHHTVSKGLTCIESHELYKTKTYCKMNHKCPIYWNYLNVDPNYWKGMPIIREERKNEKLD